MGGDWNTGPMGVASTGGGQLIELEGEGQTMYSLGTGYYVLGLDTKG